MPGCLKLMIDDVPFSCKCVVSEVNLTVLCQECDDWLLGHVYSVAGSKSNSSARYWLQRGCYAATCCRPCVLRRTVSAEKLRDSLGDVEYYQKTKRVFIVLLFFLTMR